MSTHDWEYESSIWGISFFTCKKCAKRLAEYQMEIDETNCTKDTFVQNDYSAGFDFSNKTDAEVTRILGGGNIPNDIKR